MMQATFHMLFLCVQVERNAVIGDDEVARKKDIPIVQLNPGGVPSLPTYMYTGQLAHRYMSTPLALDLKE